MLKILIKNISIRRALKAFLFILSSLVLFITAYVFVNAFRVISETEELKKWSHNRKNFMTVAPYTSFNYLEDKARDRISVYESFIKDDFLVNGMVVHRDSSGNVIDICDSLIFSSLRYSSLRRLGYTKEAMKAWASIEKSEDKKIRGKWYRHPKCKNKATSRDMIMGLLIALNEDQTPKREEHLKNLLIYVGNNHGYIGDGPFYLSMAGTGLLDLMRLSALSSGVEAKDIPPIFDLGYSDKELTASFTEKGYRSHLLALSLFLEMQLRKSDQETRYIGTMIGQSQPAVRSLRIQWLADELLQKDPENMFFRWLRFKSAGAMTLEVRKLMLSELLNATSFPENRSPRECDRSADYLWQRSASEYGPQKTGNCGKFFNGIDFIWMASLLLSDD